MAAIETVAVDRVIAVVNAAYTAEGWTAQPDKLLQAAGRDGTTRLAVYQEDTSAVPNRRELLGVRLVFQLYMGFNPEPDEHLQIDPRIVGELAARFRDEYVPTQPAGDDDLYYFRVDRISYPDDPTGNKTRAEVFITAFGPNKGENP